MKKYLLLCICFIFTLNSFAQDLTPLPNNWVGNIFTDQSVTFENTRDPLPDTVFAKTAPDVINLPEAPDTSIFDSIWYHLGDSMPMKNHVKAGDDVFDYDIDKDAMSYFKFMYNDTALFLMLKYIDLNHQFTNRGWEICWQTKDPLRYGPDYLSATDDTLRKKSYARYTALGGGKARLLAGAISRVDASNGEGSFTYNPMADSILTDTDRTKIYWYDNGKGVIRAVVPIHFDALAYLSDPANGDISNPNDYTPFDPNLKTIINWDIKTIGKVNGTESHYWWDSPNDYAYAINYYGGRLKFTFEPVIGTDTTLADLTMDGISLVGFDKNISHYSAELPVGTLETPDLIGIPTDDYAKVEIIPATSVKGDSIERTTILNVTAHNDTVSGQYTVTFKVINNDDASLEELLLDSVLIEGFDITTYHYKVELAPGTTSVPSVAVTPTDSFASHDIFPAVNLSGDSAARTTVVEVTAEDGAASMLYSITFTVLPFTDALLDSIYLDDSLLVGFDPGIYHYQVDLALETTAIPEVVYSLSNDSAVAYKENATDLTGDSITRTTSITVVAEDGITVSHYTVTFEVLPSPESRLSSIAIDGDGLQGFTGNVFNYHVDLSPGTSEMPVISFVLMNDSAKATFTGAIDLSGDSIQRTAIIDVTAEDAIHTSNYSITFEILPYTNAYLSGINVDGTSLNNFDSLVYHYQVELPHETIEIPDVTFDLSNKSANADITLAVDLRGDSVTRTTVIDVMAEDGVTTLQYAVTFVLLPGNDASLSSLLVDGIPLVSFDPETLHYHVEVSDDCCGVPAVEYTTSDTAASAEIFEASYLTGDSLSRTTVIKVTAEDKTTIKEYTVTFSLSTTGINGFEALKNIYMSREVLVIEGFENPSIEVFNLAGKKIKSAVGQTRLNMYAASNGIYLVRIKGTPLVFKVYKK